MDGYSQTGTGPDMANINVPDELRAAFKDVEEGLLPPGSMTLETAETVANMFADAWEGDIKRSDMMTSCRDHWKNSYDALRKRLEELERERDEARQEAAFLRCHWTPPGDPIDGAENEGRHFPWEGEAVSEQQDVLIALRLVLDCVDYIGGNCRINEMVGAVLPCEILKRARRAALSRRGPTEAGKEKP